MLTENQIYKKITIVIVLYNSTDLVLECFKSIKNFRIIVVDNGKNEKILKKIENDFNIEKIIISKKMLVLEKAQSKEPKNLLI